MHFKIPSPKKIKKIQMHHRKIIFFGLLAIAITLVESCPTKAAFMTSTVVAAAKGSVKVKKDKNHNYNIQLQIKNLAEPGRLQPTKQTYVVWMVTQKDNIKNIGQLVPVVFYPVSSKHLSAPFPHLSPPRFLSPLKMMAPFSISDYRLY